MKASEPSAADPFECREGNPTKSKARPGREFLLAALLLVLAGCTTYRNESPQLTASVPLLASLQCGKTTRQELVNDWGVPAASLKGGRIVFYRLEGNGQRLRFSEEAGTWKESRHSLVLIFDANGVLEKSSFVRIQ